MIVEDAIKNIALFAGIALPLFNLPLIIRVLRRKSSEDISLYWAVGVWVCLFFMFPAALISPDYVWKIFSIINIVMFSSVVICVIKYRKKGR